MRFVGETIACWDPHGGTNHLSWKKIKSNFLLNWDFFLRVKLHIFANDFGDNLLYNGGSEITSE